MIRRRQGWTDDRWFLWALMFAVLLGIVIGLGTADWMVVPR